MDSKDCNFRLLHTTYNDLSSIPLLSTFSGLFSFTTVLFPLAVVVLVAGTVIVAVVGVVVFRDVELVSFLLETTSVYKSNQVKAIRLFMNRISHVKDADQIPIF